ncbi:hypothetical protein EJB05_32983, partial [Eragrostis curvula]
VEALICTKDWVAAARRDRRSISSIVCDLEVLEAMASNLIEEEEEMPGDPDVMSEEDVL